MCRELPLRRARWLRDLLDRPLDHSARIPTRIRGVWQGGSGMMRTGFLPIPPGRQSTCDFPTFQITGAEAACCSEANFCRDCRFWPIYPRTCPARNAANKLIVCEQAYTRDNIACGSDW
ncbi:unnamed protein product [Amoebophrya sp. A120]|nr:unnamed protein product [Amoebophrya sp. A120]|eukprot:GSA120T00002448001.1